MATKRKTHKTVTHAGTVAPRKRSAGWMAYVRAHAQHLGVAFSSTDPDFAGFGGLLRHG